MQERNQAGPLMTGRELAGMPSHAGVGYRIMTSETVTSAPLVSGTLQEVDLRPGLSAQCADLRDLTGMTVQATVDEGLGLVILLDGHVDVTFDDIPLALDTRSPRTAQAAFFNRTRPATFTRRTERGDYQRKISLSISHDWLASGGFAGGPGDVAIGRMVRQHLAMHRWVPSARAVALAEQMVRPPSYSSLLHRLYLESRCLELISEALASFSEDRIVAEQSQPALRPRDLRRMQELREMLESGAADDWDMDMIARHVGMNPTSLQRLFRQAFGTTVFDYLREYRLQRAREALVSGGFTVAQAAEFAGYNSAANFSTAFRRKFGMSPRQAKSWI